MTNLRTSNERDIIDSHLHLVDFLQYTEGFPALLRQMDETGVDRAVIFGLPVIKKWNAFDAEEPLYYLDDDGRCYYYSFTDQIVQAGLEAMPEADQARFAPLICGFNPTDRHAVKHVERLMQKNGRFWRGVGEILLRHDDLTNLTFEETARANHPAMTPVYELCAAKQLPILLHQNSTSVGRHDEYVYLHELEEVLNAHGNLTVVWAHCGLSRRVMHDKYHEMIERMLTTYPQLHLDVSWVSYDTLISVDHLVSQDWVALIERFADRFMIGSDLVGRFGELKPTLRRYDAVLQALGNSARQKVARGNAERIFFGAG